MLVTTENHYTFQMPEPIHAPEMAECWKPRDSHGFWGPLDVRDLDGRQFLLLMPFSYTTRAGTVIHVPAGFRTDMASVPRLIWQVIPPLGTYDKPAVIHDWLYQTGRCNGDTITRAQADDVLLEACECSGVGWAMRQSIYRGVRIGGWVPWNNYRRKETEKP